MVAWWRTGDGRKGWSDGMIFPAGDLVEVDLAAGTVQVGEMVYQGTRLPDFLMEILEDGGLVAHRRRQKGLV